jgi:hypothetical protein
MSQHENDAEQEIDQRSRVEGHDWEDNHEEATNGNCAPLTSFPD